MMKQINIQLAVVLKSQSRFNRLKDRNLFWWLVSRCFYRENQSTGHSPLWVSEITKLRVEKHAISYQGVTSIFLHICPWLGPSLSAIKTSLPAADTLDMEACSLSWTFFLFVSLTATSFLSPVCPLSRSPFIPHSGCLSLIFPILHFMYLTQRSIFPFLPPCLSASSSSFKKMYVLNL